jgi:FtsP/CotA-like multicopper oxidase with cupredoxin domain
LNTLEISRRALTGLGALGALTGLLVLREARGQTVPAYGIKPTVTSSMGEMGGKYFGQTPDPARTRHYYIAAEPVKWDFMPMGSDPICGMTPSANVLAWHLVRKARYIQYTDGTFTQRVPQPPRLGILGPVLRGVVGDYLEITFLNRTAVPLSMHPHGVKYDKDSEGSYYGDSNRLKSLQTRNKINRSAPGLGAAIGPNARFDYVWYLDKESGPLPTEPSSKGWLYHSHVSGEGEINLGLEGMIIVTDPKRARPDGTPNDVDREMPALFMIFNESETDPEANERAEAAGGGQSLSNLINSLPVANGQKTSSVAAIAAPNAATDAVQLKEDGERHTINGYIYGNLPGLEMNEGERVRWYLFGLGSESDLHTAHWHGLRVIEDGVRRTDTVELLPGSMKVADMVADNPGDWLFHCHVAEHMANGMFALVTVYPKGKPGASLSPDQAFLGFPPPGPTNAGKGK